MISPLTTGAVAYWLAPDGVRAEWVVSLLHVIQFRLFNPALSH